MKRILTCVVLLAFSASLFADTISLRADEWYPYNGDPEEDKKPGYMIEIAQSAWGKAGHKIDYQLMGWEESVEAAQQGKVDCVVGAVKSEAPGFYFPESSMGIAVTAFFGINEKEDWSYQGIESFDGKVIGVIEDYSYNEEIDSYVEKYSDTDKVYVASGEEPLDDLIKLAIDSKVDIILGTPAVFRAKVRKSSLRIIFDEYDRLNDAEGIYIACNPKNKNSKAYVDMLDEEIKRLRESGELSDMLIKYGLRDWEETYPLKD